MTQLNIGRSGVATNFDAFLLDLTGHSFSEELSFSTLYVVISQSTTYIIRYRRLDILFHQFTNFVTTRLISKPDSPNATWWCVPRVNWRVVGVGLLKRSA